MLRKSCFTHDFRVHVDRGVKPDLLATSELDLLFVNRDTIGFGAKLLFTCVCVSVKPVMNGLSGSADAEPLQKVADLCQRRRNSMESASQPDGVICVSF